MPLSQEAKETAQFLVQALKERKIDRSFSFMVITSKGSLVDEFAHTKPHIGVLDNTFRIPISDRSSMLELDEHGLIAFSEQWAGVTGLWEVRLTNGLVDFVGSQSNIGEKVSTTTFQPPVFISFSSQDQRFKDQLETELTKTYHNIWSDKVFLGGERVWSEIFNRIAGCEIFIYLMSLDSIKSFACRVELSEAMRLDKQIVPVLIRPANVPSYIKTKYNCINATTEDAFQASRLVVSAISKLSSYLTLAELPHPFWRQPDNQRVEASPLVVSVSVPANVEPTRQQIKRLNTGVILLPGDTVAIEATGKITNDILNGQPRTWITPDGIDQWGRCSKEHHAYWKDQCVGALVGWISGADEYGLSSAFLVGNTCEKHLTQDDPEGFLYLAVNDSIDQYGDNDKEFTVEITVKRPL